MSKANQDFNALLDANGKVIPALPVQDSHALITTILNTSVRIALPGDGVMYRISASADVWLKFGDVTVDAVAGEMLFFSGTEPLRFPVGVTHLAALAVDGAAGVLVGITEQLGEVQA